MTADQTPVYDITVPQGASWSKTFTYETRDDDGASVPVDLTGFTGKAQIRVQRSTAANLVADMAVLIQTGGKVVLSLTKTQTLAMSLDVAYYDVFLTAPSGDVTKFVMGRVLLSDAVTVL